jgi:hypothetical protein
MKRCLIATVVLAAMGCGGSTPADDVPLLLVRAVDWNPTQTPMGMVAAVGELDDLTVVFSDIGATVLAGGAVLAQDSTVHSWRGATLIPAGDGNGSWLVGIDGDGRLLRLHTTGTFEDISDRYGLSGEPVRAIASLGGTRAAFGLATTVAIADGMNVTRYDLGAYDRLAGGGGRVATLYSGQVRVFDPVQNQAFSYTVAQASDLTLDESGKLFVTAGSTLFGENAQGQLERRYFAGNATLHGLVASGGRVWFAVGAELGMIETGAVSRTSGANINLQARLLTSPSGDVWTLAAGQLGRVSLDAAAMAKLRTWESTVRPVFIRSCTPCHLPGGTAGIDLSTYPSWAARLDVLYKRVITERSMPPAGYTLDDASRQAIQDWLTAAGAMTTP